MSSHHSRSSSPEPSQKTSDLSLIEDLLAQQQRLKPKMVVGNDTITTTTTEDHLLSNSIVPATTSTSSTSSYSFNDEQEVSVFTEEFYSNVLEEGEGDESGMYMSMQATESASDLTEIKLLLLRQASFQSSSPTLRSSLLSYSSFPFLFYDDLIGTQQRSVDNNLVHFFSGGGNQ